MHYTVFDFAGTGGVALAMYNTDAVSVCHICFCCYFEWKLYFTETCVQ